MLILTIVRKAKLSQVLRIGKRKGFSYRCIRGIIHALHGNLVAGQGVQLLGEGRSDDRAHVTDLGSSASKDEGVLLAAGILGDAVLARRASV